MTPEQIREIVSMTLDELIARKLIERNNYSQVLSVVDKRLYNYFKKNEKQKPSLTPILHRLADDPYIDIIYLQYRDGKTIEWIAEALNKDVSTIKRNKKRLILTIHRELDLGA